MEHDDMNDHMSCSAFLPLAASGFYGHHGHHGGHHEGLEELILSNAMHSGHSAIQSDIHTASVNGMKETSDAARDSVDATNNIGNLNLQAAERNGGETRSTVHLASGVVRDQMSAHANQAQRDHTRIISELCDVRKETSDHFATTNLEIAKQHGEIQLEMCKQHADLARQADTNAARAAQQLAECCCEIKELVRAENGATRQLMQSNLLDDANRRASEAQNELNLLKIQAAVSVGGPGNS